VNQRAASARPPKQSAFTRYYLDVALVGIGAILYYQLDRTGKLTTERLFGDQTVDPVRLLTPAFFILTVGIVFLRLFPLVLRVLSFAISKGQGSSMVIGMWQLVRNPVHYARLVLLLMLATAVGTFAASFGSTLERSFDDRAAYAAGSGLRISGIRSAKVAGPDQLAPAVMEASGSQAATPVFRTRGGPALIGNQIARGDFDVLGVDPAGIGTIGYFRDDFADGSMEERLALLDSPSTAERPVIPAEARYLGLWFNPTELRGRVAIEVRLIDSSGRQVNYIFGPENGQELPPGWYFGVLDLQQPLRGFGQVSFLQQPPAGPFELDSVSVRFATRVSAIDGALLVDDLQWSAEPPLSPFAPARVVADFGRAQATFAQPTVLVDFDSVDEWRPLAGLTSQPLNDALRVVEQPSGPATELRWRSAGVNPLTHGMRPAPASEAIPVLASDALLDNLGYRIGDTFSVSVNNTYFDVRIVDDFNLFPTLDDPRRRPAMIVPLDRLTEALNANPRGTAVYADEVWLQPGPGSEARLQQAIDAGTFVGTSTSFESLRAEQEKDPLIAAGWEGILFISFAAILLLSAIGFLIYSYLTAQRRTLEFAVLRTMGFSRRQIATVVGFEQLFVIGLGMAAGTLLGLRLGTLMIRYMGVTETGADVLPPMVQHVSWTTIGTAWLVLGAAFLVTIGIVVLLYSRLALHRVLRIGES
jgi:hypothetical protein